MLIITRKDEDKNKETKGAITATGVLSAFIHIKNMMKQLVNQTEHVHLFRPVF